MTPALRAAGAELHHEVRGTGPAALMIPGALGDGGTFDRVAPLLAEEFTVVTYDRRGNSRSPRPPGWRTTSVAEQAGDAAALLEALGLAPAVLYGTSAGGAIALEAALRHPGAVRGLVLHEPWLPALAGGGADGLFGDAVERAWREGGPGAAVDAFLRAALGDAAGALDPDRPSRIRGNGEVAFRVESPAWAAYAPDPGAVRALGVPVALLCGRASPSGLRAGARALAALLGLEPLEVAGGHAPQLDHPRELAAAVLPLLRRMWEV